MFFSSLTRLERFLTVVLVLFGAMWIYAVGWGSEDTRPWQVVSELHEKEVEVSLNSIPGLPVAIAQPVYYVQQYWLPSAVTVPTLVWRFAGIVTWIIWLSMAFGFYQWGKRYFGLWTLYLAITLFCFRFDVLWESTYTYLPFWFIICVGLYTYAIQHDWISQGKGIALALGTLLLFAVTWYGAQVTEPLAVLWGYGSLWVFLVALWFIAWVGPTLLSRMFALVLSNAQKGKSSWPALLGITVVYLINIAWLYAVETKWIEPTTIGIKPVYVFFISLLTGAWFFRQQHQQHAEHRFPIWIWIGGALSVITVFIWVELAWLDSWQEALSEWITIAFFWMGLAYVIHLAINFAQPIQAGLNVVKIWHQPRRIPWILPQLGGLVACIVTISFKNGYTLDQGIAGMYIQQAAYHQAAGETNLAETLYREGIHHDPYGWKGNYALGMMARQNQETDVAANYFNRILQKRPEPAAAIALAQCLTAENMFFDGIFSLQKVVQKNPEVRVMTQLAYLFSQAKAIDSAAIYTQRAFSRRPDGSVERTNYLASCLQTNAKPQIEPTVPNISTGEKANWSAIARLTGTSYLFDPDTTRPQGVDRFAWVFNQSFIPNAPQHSPQTWGVGAPGWEIHQKELTFAQANQAFSKGPKVEGLEILRRIVLSSGASTPPLFLFTYADWLAQEGAWERFQSEIMPFLSAEQRMQVLPGRVWNDIQEKQFTSWQKQKMNAKESLKAYPFNEKIVLASINQIMQTEGKAVGYRYLVEAINYYDAPVSWWEKYVELAAAQGLGSYVNEGLEEVKKRDTERYRKLVNQYGS